MLEFVSVPELIQMIIARSELILREEYVSLPSEFV